MQWRRTSVKRLATSWLEQIRLLRASTARTSGVDVSAPTSRRGMGARATEDEYDWRHTQVAKAGSSPRPGAVVAHCQNPARRRRAVAAVLRDT